MASKLAEKLTALTKLVEVGCSSDIPAGTQIAVKKLVGNLNSKLLSKTKEEYYFHHGVYIGEYKVIHFYGENKKNAKPQQCNLLEFIAGCERSILYRVEYVNAALTLPVEETLKMANDILADPTKWPKFRIFWNNCETFATWLKTKQKVSFQVIEVIMRTLPRPVASCSVAIGMASSSGGAKLAAAADKSQNNSLRENRLK